MACIIANGAGTIKSNKRWFAPTGPRNDCYFVFIPKHKVYQAQRIGQVEREGESGNTCIFGNCPRHPGVVFSTKWFAFIEEDEDIPMYEEQAEQSINAQEPLYEEKLEAMSEVDSKQCISPPAPMSDTEFDQPSIPPAPLS
jgi:hypothetical protein